MNWPKGREAVFLAALFTTASLGFAAGYLVRQNFGHAPIIIEKKTAC